MYNLIAKREDGDLGILEPDFVSVPVTWTEDLTRTLSHNWYQKEVCASVGLLQAMAFPSYRQSAIICDRLKGSDRVVMDRADTSELNSGWFVGCGDGSHDHNRVDSLQRVSLYEAAVQNEKCIPYLALPKGCFVDLCAAAPCIIKDGVELPPLPGSLLAAMRKLGQRDA